MFGCFLQLLTSKEAIKVMIDHMSNPENSTHLPVKKGITYMLNFQFVLLLKKIVIITSKVIHCE